MLKLSNLPKSLRGVVMKYIPIEILLLLPQSTLEEIQFDDNQTDDVKLNIIASMLTNVSEENIEFVLDYPRYGSINVIIDDDASSEIIENLLQKLIL